jgi:hypothetical protein
LAEDQAEVAVVSWVDAVRGYRGSDVPGGLLVIAHLVSDQTKKVEGVAVPRLDGERLAVGGLGLRQAARPMFGEAARDPLDDAVYFGVQSLFHSAKAALFTRPSDRLPSNADCR